jgi:hypothetical protein
MTNVIYNEKTGRARLIDFELVHEKSLRAKSRHADDLLVFLLDILAIVPTRQWLPFALYFLNTYENARVIAALEINWRFPAAWLGFGGASALASPTRRK